MDFSRYLQATRQGCVDPLGATRYWKDSPSPPPAPDYAGLAKQQGTENLAAAQASAKLSNPNITSPLGSRTITYGGGSPTFDQQGYDAAMKAWQESAGSPSADSQFASAMWGDMLAPSSTGSRGPAPSKDSFWLSNGDPNVANETIKLSPEQQKLYDMQTQLSQGLLGLGQGSLNQTANSLGKPQDLQSIQDIADQSYGMQTQRLDPQWTQNQQGLDAKLANQGIPLGSEAHANAMREFSQAKNDAYNQARLSSISTMPQTYQLSTAQRMQPLTELNAIRTGAQPQMPQFQPISGVTAGAAPVMQAGQAQAGYDQGLYNANVGQQNSMMSGLFGLGGAVAGGLPWGSILGF